MNNILIVEDEHLIARLIEMTLTRAGYRCTLAEDGRTAADLIETTNFDMALLDIMLPGLDGYALLECLRPQGVPVIFITAKSAVKDRVQGLRLGADDYITKPFNPLELTARVKTQLRRYTKYNHSEAEAISPAREYDINGLVINKDTHTCTLFNSEITLTPLEFDILWYLCERKGKVVPAEELFQAVWGEKYLNNSNTVMAHIGRLREKLGEPAKNPRFIKTVWGVGYKIE